MIMSLESNSQRIVVKARECIAEAYLNGEISKPIKDLLNLLRMLVRDKFICVRNRMCSRSITIHWSDIPSSSAR
jgi:hypothetical protein